MEKKKILIVDDELTILTVLKTRFEHLGFDVCTSSNGKEALGVAREEIPDLILLDIMMPGMNGMEVKALLNQDGITADIPVIFLTAKTQTSSKVEGFEIGAEDYITKPFSAQELVARVNRAINKKKHYEKMAMTDGLTGLYNVHFFQKQFPLFFCMAKRYEKMFSLALIDVNSFKSINDTQGHAAGDFVLKKLASILTETLRETDLVVRYGGDEFAVLFPEEGENDAIQALERVKEKLVKNEFLFEETGQRINFTISCGISEYKAEFNNEIRMFETADINLYEDKKIKTTKYI